MAVDIDMVRRRVIAAVHAAPNAGWVAAVTGQNGSFPTDNEINQCSIESDAVLIRDAIDFNHPYSNTFMVSSSPVAHGDKLTAHIGEIGKTEWRLDTNDSWKPSRAAANKDEVINMVRFPNVYGGAAEIYGWHWIEINVVYHTSPLWRFDYPNFIPNASSCQMHEAYEDAVFAGNMAMLVNKIGGFPDLANYYLGYFNAVRAEIRGRSWVIPAWQSFNVQTDKVLAA